MAWNITQRATQFFAALGLVIVFFLFNAWVLYFTFHKVVEQEAWVAHTGDVISELDNLLTASVDMETGQRGFLLTNEDSFLAPYRLGVDEVDVHLRNLGRLVGDNAVQELEVQALSKMLFARKTHLESGFTYAPKLAKSDPNRVHFLETGRGLMESLRNQIAKMKASEINLERTREESAARMRDIFMLVLLLTALMSIATVSFAARLIRSNQSRLETEARERDAVARVRDLVAIGATSSSGSLSPMELSTKIQEFLASKLEALASKVFLYSGGRLECTGSFGTALDSAKGARVRSLVDEAATRSKLWWVKDVPSDYWEIRSELGSARPKQLVFLPLFFQGRKLGVVEMAFFRELTPQDVEVLERLLETFSIAMNAALSRKELQELLERSQSQAEELEAQQEELKASNEELEQQARALESQQQSLNIKNKELEGARRDLESRAEELQRSTRYKSDFLAKMSHELRTPLNGLMILSTLLVENKEKTLTEQQQQFAQSIKNSGNDLLLLINDILDLSKIEARKLAIRTDWFSLKSLVESLMNAFAPQAEAKNLEFRVQIDPAAENIKLHTDRLRLEQILRNFLSNALKFTQTGHISIEAKIKNAGMIEIAVADSGIGIPREKHSLIFDAFEQADGSVSRRFGGTGLGLTISRELAVLLGGGIRVESTEGNGSCFILSIPPTIEVGADVPTEDFTPVREIAPREKARITNTEMNRQAQEAIEKVQSGRRTIMIVEDDETFLQAVVETCESYGFQTISARDGEVAIAILDRFSPDAVLLDIKLPGISGLGLLEMIKHMPQLRHIPVHMISALDHQHSALRMGALGYLTKPVTMEKIRSALERIESMISEHVRRILLIEDDERQSLAIANLVSGKDAEIIVAKTGKDALAKLKDLTFDCVILDINLPDISGFEMLEQLNSLEISVPPIVIYTAQDLTQKEEEYLRKYSESIIIKGARSPERLLDEVNLFLHRVESMMAPEKRQMISQMRTQKDNFEGKTVLIVDDDLRNVFALTSALESKNLNVRIAKDGIEALELLQKHSDISLVLMDIMMPRMDGFEAMRQIRKMKDERIRNLPVVALTAKAMREDHEKCIAAGANDYIPKPVDLEQLTTVLKVWLHPRGIFA